MKKYSYTHIITTLFILFFAGQLLATGILYVRPRFSTSQYEKVWIKSIDVNTQIQDHVAETHVDQVFFNELTSSVEAIYIFPLPENAMITELVYWVNGERFEAEIRERQDAVSDYNDKLRQWMDPALLEYLGDNLFRLSIVPINAQTEFRTEITYIELLNYDFGVSHFKYLMNTLDLSSQPLQTVHLKLDAQSQNPFKIFQSSSHENSAATQIDKLSDTHYTIEFGDENFFPDRDFKVEFETYRSDVEFSLLTYTPTIADSFGTESFYALWVTPPDSIAEDEAISKDIVFTADVSSSMEGQRLQQLKESLHAFLDNLAADDYFNIITFGTHVISFKDDLVQASAANIQAARDFTDDLFALGLTNISSALETSLSQSYREYTSRNLVFLTDGRPTFGETFPDSIVAQTFRNNNNAVRLFSFGIGEDLNRALLTQLSLENDGYATFIPTDDSISVFINNHFKRISKPVMIDLNFDYSQLDVKDRYPKIQQDLYWGTQSLEMGLYNGTGLHDVTLSGWLGQDSLSFTKSINFTDSLGGFRFVPRLWAQAKINHLMDLIAIYGEVDELVDQVIELSLTFQIVTPYTALYVDPTALDNEQKVVPGSFKLYANYPNPFNPSTTIKYNLPAGQPQYKVKLKIYNALGQLILTLVDDLQKPGEYQVQWHGINAEGSHVPSGIYFCVIEAGDYRATQKMLLVR